MADAVEKDHSPAPKPGNPYKIAAAMLGTLFLALTALAAVLFLNPKTTSASTQAKESKSAAPSASPAPVETKEAAPITPIVFVKQDDTRAGNWKKDLGKDGYIVFSKGGNGVHDQKLPPYVEDIQTVGDHYRWAWNDDKRGLEDPAGAAERCSACLYSGNEVWVNINTKRPTPYRLSFYCLDYDRCGRAQTLEMIKDGKTFHTLDMPAIGEGKWLHYDVVGSVSIKLSCTGAANAVIAGVFFDSGKDHIPAKRPIPTSIPDDAKNLKQGIVGDLFEGLGQFATAENNPTLRIEFPTLKLGSNPPLQPGQGLRNWPFSGAMAVVFSGFVVIDEDNTYTLFTESDDGSKLYIDGTIVVDNDGSHGIKEASGARHLTKGLHRIWVEYFNAGGLYAMNAYIQKQGGAKQALAEQLRYDPNE
jgi:hypothetical protein